MKRFVRVFCVLLAVVLLAAMLVGCGATRPVRASSRANKVVATAGEVKIRYEELYYIAMNYIKELELTYGEDALQSEAVCAELESFVWGKLLSAETALISLGYKYGLDVYKGEIAERVSEDIAEIINGEFEGDREAYIKSLEESFMTEHYARKSFGANNYLASEIELLCAKNLNVDDATVRADIEKGDFICFRLVLVKNETGDAAGDAAARATAERIQAELAAIPDDAVRRNEMTKAIASADNKDLGDTLGYGYYYPRGYLSGEYEETLFNLKNYEVGKVLKNDEGYAVVMRMPIDGDYVEKHLYDLKRLYSKLEYNRQVTAEYESLRLEKTKFGEKLDLTALPPIDMDGGSTTILWVSVAGGTVLALSAILGIVYRTHRKRKLK